MHKLRCGYTLFALCVALWTPAFAQSFALFPGMQAHFAQNPQSATAANAEQQNLLQRYKPRVFVAKNQSRMIDFYADYIAHGTLWIDGEIVSSKVTQALLNRYRDHPLAEFKYHHSGQPTQAVSYASFSEAPLISSKGERLQLQWLSYNFVFPTSGLLYGLTNFQRIAAGLIGDLDDWHQLDHYVSVVIALAQDRPVAMMLQQHNDQRTYLLDPSSSSFAGQNVAVDIALSSNELYPHHPEPQRHRAVSFITIDNIEFVLQGTNKPFIAGYDVTHGEQEVNYDLRFLAQNDAFYSFVGRLGESRLLPGRDGPPGAQYVSLPALLPLPIRAAVGFRLDDVAHEKQRMAALWADGFAINPMGIPLYADHFYQQLNLLIKNRDKHINSDGSFKPLDSKILSNTLQFK